MVTNRFKVLLAEKEIRDARNWSYREISAVTGVSPNTLSDYSRNQVQRFDAVTLDALCTFFECRVGDLLVHALAGKPRGNEKTQLQEKLTRLEESEITSLTTVSTEIRRRDSYQTEKETICI